VSPHHGAAAYCPLAYRKPDHAKVLPQWVENWLIARTRAEDTTHFFHAPSLPFAYSSGKLGDSLAVIRYAKIHGTKHRPWLTALLARRPTKVAAIALANKIGSLSMSA
jgi:hypothetical protein